ncbi:glycosyltransferase family 4 protein [Arenibaculum pallidiluteum]|uniref:glycosyltransferase family 4 protein n=1 Tax=Arenibaculum pallidiluteum TaxID=2812559 RepID=UPI001A96A7A5|nr:glycosyltransferase family 4 protein [Arenibaculum pallidiluteum]
MVSITPAALARRLWLGCPPGLRRRLLGLALDIVVPRAAGSPPGDGSPTVAGLLRSPTGLGRGARLQGEAFRALGRCPEAADLTALFHDPDPGLPAPRWTAREAGAPPPRGPVIVHLNAPNLRHALAALGRRRIRGRRIVGYWAWELPVLPAAWLPALVHLHEVWTPSAFSAAAIAAATEKPVRVVPHPVAIAQPGRAALGRAAFGLREQDFVALTAFHPASGIERKNPLGTIRAFREAFGGRPGAVLVLKIGGEGPLPWLDGVLAQAGGAGPDIAVLRGDLPDAELTALMACSDVLLSLHRSEGFGLVLAEAMQLGIPVVATAWSGNLDFMPDGSAALVEHCLVPVADPEAIYGDGSHWAEPDTGHAAAWLRRLAADFETRRRLGEAGSAAIAERCGLTAFARALESPPIASGVPAAQSPVWISH